METLTSCQYSFLFKGQKIILGTWSCPVGKDVDDCFPAFVNANMNDCAERIPHMPLIKDSMGPMRVFCENVKIHVMMGAVLLAENLTTGETIKLCYSDPDDAEIFLGRVVTLRFLGVPDVREDS